jgi:3-hydroxyisobutyrate dehydrogenase-like beta-hydroxyacid dehydrogenase
MGIGMALNLQKHLQETKQQSLHYSNRTLSKGESLMAAGGIEEPNYAVLVKSCDIIFTMVGHFSHSIQFHTLI